MTEKIHLHSTCTAFLYCYTHVNNWFYRTELLLLCISMNVLKQVKCMQHSSWAMRSFIVIYCLFGWFGLYLCLLAFHIFTLLQHCWINEWLRHQCSPGPGRIVMHRINSIRSITVNARYSHQRPLFHSVCCCCWGWCCC